jgi:hypothetical protein
MVLGINSGDDVGSDLDIFLDAFQVSFPILVSGDEVYFRYQQPGATSPYPLDYVIDQEGIVSYFSTEYEPERMVAVIDELLGNEPALSVDPDSLYFGPVEVGQSADLFVAVHNGGDGDLDLHSIATGDPVFSVNLGSLIVPPGATRSLRVTFAPEAGIAYQDSLWLASNDPQTPLLTLPLIGIGGDGVGVDDFRPEGARLASKPNPFGRATQLHFTLPASGRTWITIHDVRGRVVRHLSRGEMLPAGNHQLPWDGRDDAGRSLASGIYFTRLRTADQVITRKITLLR